MSARANRGLGRVFQRGPIWWIQFSIRGRKIRETSRSTTRSKAVKLLRQRLEEATAGRFIPNSERIGFSELKQLLIDDYKANGRRSLDRAELSIRHLEAFFGNDLAIDITPDRLVRYLNERLATGAAPATVQAELSALKRMFTLAWRCEKVTRRPAFPPLKVDNARAGFFEEADFRAILAELPADLRPVMEFAYLTGWRKGEILGLEWSRVDFTAGVVRLDVRTTKNSEGRTFPINALPALENLLKAQRARTDTIERQTGQIIRWVFHRGGQPILSYYTAWRAACRRTGQVGRIVHDFRRTAVRNLERAGVSRSVAMKLTGHKTEAVYRRYAIVAEQDLREGVAKLATLHAGTPTRPAQASIIPISHQGAA